MSVTDRVKAVCDLAAQFHEESWYSLNLSLCLSETTPEVRATIKAFLDGAKSARTSAPIKKDKV